ncbi:aminodeoxychorismate synthase component I [Streptomyces fuscichromogenes]|uniref:aminodeoxychorismate synthase n=1 Tax=Streptomyces fuscichromogenes TaxID=1324013 RepID=A0A918CXH5_9ACTN|nr:aminodeoxychorismate synthase component I [Streptomyces fuscichromogenes]GGN45428.1 aminodeoxychorismate synthase, component I [Streptomyces fuscichromogenes]
MQTLLIDHRDSYTFNLYQFIAAVNGRKPVVIRHDDPQLATADLDAFDNIVLSPGPGRPQVEQDLGYSAQILGRTALPVLGVCLGHQAVAHLAGATVSLAPRPRHGHVSRIRHADPELFDGIPQDFSAVRYHSLRVEEPFPETLEATAWSEDGVVMALRHRLLPRWGVQFHPESISTEHGHALLENFRRLTQRRTTQGTGTGRVRTPLATTHTPKTPGGPALVVTSRAIPAAIDTETLYRTFFESSSSSFWLDGGRTTDNPSRFSFLGDVSGPLSEVLTYRLETDTTEIRTASGVRTERGSIFALLERQLAERTVTNPGFPFDFVGGYVGYFGYEMKEQTGGDRRHRSDAPDACWMFADRLIVVDHEEGSTYVVAVHGQAVGECSAAQTWVDATTAEIRTLPVSRSPGITPLADRLTGVEPSFVRDRARYLADIAHCLEQLRQGESYEICLTNKLRLRAEWSDGEFYRMLRHRNPAPYSALLRFPELTVFSSSPERFLKIHEGIAETKPIKGTVARGADFEQDAERAARLADDAKTRAENLMIVDLVRNDLGQVCDVGTVDVTDFMAVESYATVHQLVSTVRGRLMPGITPIECVRRCFPGGSMTGAPKHRAMQIIDRLETEARGVYSGALGYFGLAGGADLSMVIRTAVRSDEELTIGCGGAIVLDSDPEAEFDEIVLKADAVLRALRPGRVPELVSAPAGAGS